MSKLVHDVMDPDTYTINLTEELYAVLVLTGMLGYLVNRLFIAAEKRIVFWAGQ
jgi:hypothetical protein